MKRKVLSLILASALLVSNSFSVFASQEIGNSIEAIEYQEVNEDESYDETSVEATIASHYDITIPKVIVLAGSNSSASKASYEVSIDGDIAGNEQINVVPEDTVKLYSKNKDMQLGTITQDITTWYYSTLNDKAKGNIEANLTAGRWSGTFWFNIKLLQDDIIAQQNYIRPEQAEITIIKNLSAPIKMYYKDEDITQNCIFSTKDTNILVTDNEVTALEPGTAKVDVKYVKDDIIFNYTVKINVISCTHNFEKISTEDETCTQGSVDTYKCSICGDIKTQSDTPAHGHNFILTDTIEKTCVKDGVKHFVCEYCDEVHDEILGATGHVYNITNYVIDTPATCEHPGQKSVHCEVCGEIIESTVVEIEQEPHIFTNYVSNNDATCTQNGTKTARCDTCGEAYDIIEDEGTKLNHPYTEETIEPTCITQGYTYYTCDVCGDSIANVIPALGHNFVNGTCTRCGKFDISELEPGLYDSSYTRTKTFDELLENNTFYLDEAGALTSNIVYLDDAHQYTTDKNESSDAVDGILILPSSVKTLKPNSIAYLLNLKTIFIPESVTTIENGAIKGNPELEAVIVDEDNKNYKVEDNILFNSDKSTLLLYPAKREGTVYQIPSSVNTLYSGAFSEVQLANILIPDTVTSIGGSCFRNSKQLKSIDLSKNIQIKDIGTIHKYNELLTSAYYGVFDGCESLKQVKLPESVRGIGDRTFFGCTSLETVNISPNLQRLGRCVFNGTPLDLGDLELLDIERLGINAFENVKIKSLTTGSKLSEIETGRLFDTASQVEKIDLSQSTKLTQIGVIVVGTASSATGAFSSLTNLKEVALPESLSGIGDNTFNGCSSLTSITGLENVRILGASSLRATNLSGDIYMPNVEEIDTYAFYNSPITSFKAGDKLRILEETSIFRDCAKLKSVDLSASKIDTVGLYSAEEKSYWGVCYNCPELEEVKLPSTVKTLGSNAFCKCPKLSSITGLDGVEIVGMGAFGETGEIGDINLPSVKQIQGWAFNASGVSSVTAGENLEGELTDTVFYNCSKLTSIDLSQSKITKFGNSKVNYGIARNCTSLSTVKLPNTVKEIGYYAFSGDTNLTNITGLESVEIISVRAFSNTGEIGDIYMPKIKSVGDYAFFESGIKSFTAGADLEKFVSTSHFRNCTKLEAVDISKSKVETLGLFSEPSASGSKYGTFQGCTSLKTAKLPNTLKNIGDNCFETCSALTSITGLENAEMVGKYAFYKAGNLGELNLQKIKTVGKDAFRNSGIVSFTSGSDLKTIEPIYTFRNCTSLKSVDISKSKVTEIGVIAGGKNVAGMFSGCTSLVSAKFPDTITLLGDGTFGKDTSLTEIVLPANIPQIGYKPFYLVPGHSTGY